MSIEELVAAIQAGDQSLLEERWGMAGTREG